MSAPGPVTASWSLGLHHLAPPENQDSLNVADGLGFITTALAARLPAPMDGEAQGVTGCGCAWAANAVLFTWATLNCGQHSSGALSLIHELKRDTLHNYHCAILLRGKPLVSHEAA